MQNVLHVGGQLVDHGEEPKHGRTVRQDDGPHRRRG